MNARFFDTFLFRLGQQRLLLAAVLVFCRPPEQQVHEGRVDRLDLGAEGELAAVREALQEEIAEGRARLYRLLSLLHDPAAIGLVKKNLESGSSESTAYALEIMDMLVDREASVADCVAAGYDRETVKRVEHLLYISEYKRFQSAPGPRLSLKAFWLDRRYPVVNRWRDGG
mgnify:CR=1 FL=1